MYDFGSRLSALRKKRGLTQRDLARRINKSVSAVSGYESNAQMPPTDVLESIACVLNVSLDYLVGFEHNEIYSTNSLSAEQKEIVELLFKEFVNSTGTGIKLSPQQIEIMQKLICCFLGNK